MIKNSEKREAVAWFDEETGRLHIEFMFPFDHHLYDQIMKRVSETPIGVTDMHYDLIEEDHTLFGVDFDI
jgi:hypothetical protein